MRNTRDDQNITKDVYGMGAQPSAQRQMIEIVRDSLRLKDYVTVKDVWKTTGKQRVCRNLEEVLPVTTELLDYPPIKSQPFIALEYDAKTKRAYIPYSMELKEEDENINKDLNISLTQLIVNTQNQEIINELNTLEGTEVSSLDEIKDVINSFPVDADVKLFMAQSAFNELDKLKDGNDRYLLRSTIDKEIVVINDDQMESDQTIFIGDFKELVYMDHSVSADTWAHPERHGICYGITVISDVKKAEDELSKANIEKVTYAG